MSIITHTTSMITYIFAFVLVACELPHFGLVLTVAVRVGGMLEQLMFSKSTPRSEGFVALFTPEEKHKGKCRSVHEVFHFYTLGPTDL